MADPFGQFEKEGWNQGRAEPYHQGISRITIPAIDPLLDAAGVTEGMRVLDVATGPGYAAARAAERGAETIGVDFAPEMLALARRLHPDVDFRQGDATELDFEDESFDVVVANFLMPHLSDVPAALREFARVTRVGGRVALTTWDAPQRTRFVGAMIEAFGAAGATLPDEIPAGPSIFQYSPDREFMKLLLDAGLEQPIVEQISFTHHVDDLEAFWQDVLGGTVRTRTMVTTQQPGMQAEIRRRYEALLDVYRAEGGWEIPCSVKLGSAQRPG
jgi:ubiquinone/menaquinone biosynthesis C-methylase UbiE